MTEASLTADTRPAEHRHGVSLGEAFWVWLRVAALSFGGPAGQIAVMHRIVVDEKKWISESRFLPRAQLLHVAARPGGASAQDLHGLADASLARGHYGRRAFSYPRHRQHHGAELHLRRVRQCAGRGGAVFRAQGRGAGNRAARRVSRRQPRPQRLADADAGAGRFYRHLLFGCSLSADCAGSRRDRLLCRACRLDRFSDGRSWQRCARQRREPARRGIAAACPADGRSGLAGVGGLARVVAGAGPDHAPP